MELDTIRERLHNTLDQSHQDNSLDMSQFYRLWFPRDRSYYFLFKKNLRVTNISHAELLALLRAYITPLDEAPPCSELQFTSSR